MLFPDIGEFAKKIRVSDNDVRSAVRTLIERQFLYRGDYGSSRHYDILSHPAAGPTFSELFDWLGYRFHNRDDQNWIGLLPEDESGSGTRVPLEYTIVLLMLGFIFNQSREIGRYGTVMTTYMDLDNAFNDHLGAATPLRTKLWSILTDLKRRAIVHFDANASELEDAEIEIRPMITALLPGDLAARIETYAAKRRARRGNEAALAAAESTQISGEADDNSTKQDSDSEALGSLDNVDADGSPAHV